MIKNNLKVYMMATNTSGLIMVIKNQLDKQTRRYIKGNECDVSYGI